MLGIQAAALLLYGAEGAGDCDGGEFVQRFFTPFRMTFVILNAGEGSGNIHIGRQFYAVAVVESDFAVVDKFRLRKSLVPFLGEFKSIHILVLAATEQQHGCANYGYALFHIAKVRRTMQVFVLILADFIPISQILLTLHFNEEDSQGR